MESKTIGGKVNACSPAVLARRKQTVESAKSRSLSCCGRCTPEGTQSSGRTRENSLIQRGLEEIALENRGGQEGEQSLNCHLSSLLLFPPISLSLLCYGVISCKALLSRCGNFIFATNLQPPPLSPHSSRRLVLCPVTLHLCACPCSPLVSYPSRKFALNVQFHLHRPHPSNVSCPLSKRISLHREYIVRDVSSRINQLSDCVF